MNPIVFLPIVLGALMVVAATARLRQIAAYFRGAGATAAGRGLRADALPPALAPLVPRLVQRGVLREAPGGTLWMDEGAYAAYGRRLAVTMVAGALAGAALGWLAYRMGAAASAR